MIRHLRNGKVYIVQAANAWSQYTCHRRAHRGMLADVLSDSHFDEEFYLQILHHFPDTRAADALEWLEIQTVVPGLQLTATISCRAGPASAGNSGHSATAQLDRALSRRCVATAVVAGRVALSPSLFLPAAFCVTHEQNVVQHRCLHPTIPALLSPPPRGVCLPLHACALPQAGCYQCLHRRAASCCFPNCAYLNATAFPDIPLGFQRPFASSEQARHRIPVRGTSLNPESQWYPGESGGSRPKVALLRH